MDEEKNEEEAEEAVKTEAATTPTEEAGSEEEQAIVAKANDVAKLAKEAEELKASNLAKEEKLLERKEALAQLGGGSPAGDKPAQIVESAAQYSERVMNNDI